MAEQTVNNMEVCDHVQVGGQAFYDERKYFLFSPYVTMPCRVARFRGLGVGQQMPDGTFDFVRRPQLRPKSKLIKKLAHGRVSETKDGAIQLTLKVFRNEGLNISETIRTEAIEAADAIRVWQTPSVATRHLPPNREEGSAPGCEIIFNKCNIQNLPIQGEMSEGQRGSEQ